VYPKDLLYSKRHVWAKVSGSACRIGITEHAQDQMGEIVYADLPSEGSSVSAETPFMEIESSKIIADIYSPVDGSVKHVNRSLDKTPKLINENPYEDGWIVEISMDDPKRLKELMDSDAYEAFLEL